MLQSSSWSRWRFFIRSVQWTSECSKHVQIFPRSSEETSSFMHRSLSRTLARWYTCRHHAVLQQILWAEREQRTGGFLTFLKNRASDPVRRGRPLPVCGSVVMATAAAGRLGDDVSRNWAVTTPEESQEDTGMRVKVRSVLMPAG